MGIPAKWCSTIIFITGSFLHISIFSYFPTFLSHSLHFLPKNTRWEWLWKGKHSVFFFQLAAAHFDFWGVQSISNTPRIISSLGKSHGMVFNLALSCSDTVVIFLTCHISHYFSHIPFISLQRTHFWEAFGFDRFFIFFPVSGRVGWFWQLLTLIFGKGRISPLPLE